MFRHVLKNLIGRVVVVETSAPGRSATQMVGGCLVGLYCDGAIAAIATSTEAECPVDGAKPQVSNPDPKPAPAPAPLPAAAPDAVAPNAVIPGQALPPVPATPPPAQPPPPAATQSNATVATELIRDFNVKWVRVASILSVEHDAGLKALLTQYKIDDKAGPERLFDRMGGPHRVIKQMDGSLRHVTDNARVLWHNECMRSISEKVAALEVPSGDAGGEPVSLEPVLEELVRCHHETRKLTKAYELNNQCMNGIARSFDELKESIDNRLPPAEPKPVETETPAAQPVAQEA
jgi:hypothetical protein